MKRGREEKRERVGLWRFSKWAEVEERIRRVMMDPWGTLAPNDNSKSTSSVLRCHLTLEQFWSFKVMRHTSQFLACSIMSFFSGLYFFNRFLKCSPYYLKLLTSKSLLNPLQLDFLSFHVTQTFLTKISKCSTWRNSMVSSYRSSLLTSLQHLTQAYPLPSF